MIFSGVEARIKLENPTEKYIDRAEKKGGISKERPGIQATMNQKSVPQRQSSFHTITDFDVEGRDENPF